MEKVVAKTFTEECAILNLVDIKERELNNSTSELQEKGIICEKFIYYVSEENQIRQLVQDVLKNNGKIAIDDFKMFEKSFPLSRVGTPKEVADLVLFLTSDKSSYITGATININGGDLLV